MRFGRSVLAPRSKARLPSGQSVWQRATNCTMRCTSLLVVVLTVWSREKQGWGQKTRNCWPAAGHCT